MSFKNPDRLKKNSAKKVTKNPTKNPKTADKTIAVKKLNNKPK